MKLTKLLERLDYKVVTGSDNIEITELVNDSRKDTIYYAANLSVRFAPEEGASRLVRASLRHPGGGH